MIFLFSRNCIIGKFQNICRITIILAKIGQNIHVLQIFNKNVLIFLDVGEKFAFYLLTNSQLCLFSKMFANSFRENHKSPRVTFAQNVSCCLFTHQYGLAGLRGICASRPLTRHNTSSLLLFGGRYTNNYFFSYLTSFLFNILLFVEADCGTGAVKRIGGGFQSLVQNDLPMLQLYL